MKSNFFILILLLTIAIFSLNAVGGIFPKKINISPSKGGLYKMITPEPKNPEESLQLKLIKFKGCSVTSAVNFLVDRSGSMASGNKLPLLQEGLLTFSSRLSDQSIFGLQTFAQDWKLDIAPESFGIVKNRITDIICQINPNGATYTKDAFIKTKEVLEKAKKDYAKHDFYLIFFSDGVPETIESDTACIAGNCRAGTCQCFAPEQDPTDIANQIKAMGVKIYSVAYIDGSDKTISNKLETMMKNIATSEEYYFGTPNESEVIEILNKISKEICEE